MARTRIYKKDGTPTPFFWSDKDGSERTRQTVYRQTPSGVKRMKGVHFHVEKNEFQKE